MQRSGQCAQSPGYGRSRGDAWVAPRGVPGDARGTRVGLQHEQRGLLYRALFSPGAGHVWGAWGEAQAVLWGRPAAHLPGVRDVPGPQDPQRHPDHRGLWKLQGRPFSVFSPAHILPRAKWHHGALTKHHDNCISKMKHRDPVRKCFTGWSVVLTERVQHGRLVLKAHSLFVQTTYLSGIQQTPVNFSNSPGNTIFFVCLCLFFSGAKSSFCTSQCSAEVCEASYESNSSLDALCAKRRLDYLSIIKFVSLAS